MRKIRIKIRDMTFTGNLDDSTTALKIYELLPLKESVSVWGKELYFKTPLDMDIENGVDVVREGDMCYWPPGRAFCIFYGRTPVSTAEEIRPYSTVSLIGRLEGSCKRLEDIRDGDVINIEGE